MKKLLGVLFLGSVIVVLFLRGGMMKNPRRESIMPSPIVVNTSNPLETIDSGNPHPVNSPKPSMHVISADRLVATLFTDRNFSHKMNSSMLTWNHMKRLINYSEGLPNAVEAIREAQVAWESLVDSFERANLGDTNESSHGNVKERLCPYFINQMNTTDFGDNGYKLRTPCGLIQGSAITIIAIPNSLLDSFRIDLAGEPLPGEPEPPIIFHYNVRLLGDKLTEEPVIVQNTWTPTEDWGEEERCPPSIPGSNMKETVDELRQCNEMVGKEDSRRFMANKLKTISTSRAGNQSKASPFFPFKQGHLSVMTLRVGEEGFQMTVDGKHITSFAYREQRLEPWLVNEVKISGDLKLLSVLASSLPSSEGSEHTVDLDSIKSVQLPSHQPLDLFIGVFSAANNFKRRMAVRRAWMQYPEVKAGAVAVRFFVGLHKSRVVNEELFTELKTYGDIQLMPFVEYYSLLTWKTIAICIFGVEVASAKYVMKTDDDAFVCVDQVLASLNRANVSHGLLYGLINSDARPHRNSDSKWYISPEEWPESIYPPWAHGPGYVVSRDIAKEVCKWHKEGHLKMFKLEDVAMGIWIADMEKVGLHVSYINEERIYTEGCEDGYVVAHYQSPREMLCLWQKLQRNETECCSSQQT